MNFARTALRIGCITAFLCTGSPSQAADACGQYKWNVSHEVRLFAGTSAGLRAAVEITQAPPITTDQLYALTLQPQENIRYTAPPSKRMLADGAYGGLLGLTVTRSGQYRISIDAGFWLDVVRNGKALEATDFNGQRDCAGPRKIVVYELPAGVPLILQIAASTQATARLTVTPVAASNP